MSDPIRQFSSEHSTPPASTASCTNYTSCANCVVRQCCIIHELSTPQVVQFEQLVQRRKRLRRGDYAFREEEQFNRLLVIRKGSFKSEKISAQGHLEIAGFYGVGDVLGLESVLLPFYQSEAVALEDSQVCEVSFSGLQSMATGMPALHQELIRRLRAALVSHQCHMQRLKSRSEPRFASFLCELAQKAVRQGNSATTFQLQMSKGDIGHYLGLTKESMSRLIAKFKEAGLIELNVRHVAILNRKALEDIACNAVRWKGP